MKLQEAVVSGTPVTRDTFAAWKDAFIKEQEQSNALRPDPSASKLTGTCRYSRAWQTLYCTRSYNTLLQINKSLPLVNFAL